MFNSKTKLLNRKIEYAGLVWLLGCLNAMGNAGTSSQNSDYAGHVLNNKLP